MPAPPGVVAIQDIDCVDRAKFRFHLPTPPPADFLARFADATVTLHRFSQLTPLGRDLRTIVKPGAFHCASIAEDRELVVSFAGDQMRWPEQTMADFAARLADAGYGAVDYRRGDDGPCSGCPMRVGRRCAGR